MKATEKVTLRVNGQSHERDVEPRRLLVHFIREDLALTGTHVGCDTTQCGACTVHCDGDAVKSCTMFAVQANGCSITTIEGLGTPEQPHVLQETFRRCHALQCGFCTPGMIMCAADLLGKIPHPTETQIRDWIDGNVCRCTGYQNIVTAIAAAAEAPATRGS